MLETLPAGAQAAALYSSTTIVPWIAGFRWSW
jgi:hypothetical protein